MMPSKSPRPKRHALGEFKKSYRAMRSKIKTPRGSTGNMLDAKPTQASSANAPRHALSTSSLPRDSSLSRDASPSSSAATPQRYGHVRDLSRDERQLRAGGVDISDDLDDIDGKLQKLLDDRDRYQLKLEDVEEKAENLESSRQDVIDSGGTWTPSHEKRYNDKAAKYAKKVERYRKQLEAIDDEIVAYNELDSAERRKNRFSLDRGSMKQFVTQGITGASAGFRRRMFNTDARGGGDEPPDSDDVSSESGAARGDAHGDAVGGHANGHHYAPYHPQQQQQQHRHVPPRSVSDAPMAGRPAARRDSTGGDSVQSLPVTLQRDMPPVDEAGPGTPSGSPLRVARGRSVLGEARAGAGAQGVGAQGTPPRGASGGDDADGVSMSTRGGDVDSLAGDTVSIGSGSLGVGASQGGAGAGGKKSRFGGLFRSKDKSANTTLLAGAAHINEHEAVQELRAMVDDLKQKCQATLEASEQSTKLRDEQFEKLNQLEAALASRDEELAAAKRAMGEYDKRIESMVLRYEKQLQDDVAHVKAQLAEEHKKVAKLESEMAKNRADVRTAEADIKKEFAAQQGVLQKLQDSRNFFEVFLEEQFGPHVQPEMVYGGMIVAFTLAVLNLLLG